MPLAKAAILERRRKFSNVPDPNFDLSVISFICTNFEAFTTFDAIFTCIRRTIQCVLIKSVVLNSLFKLNNQECTRFKSIYLTDPTCGRLDKSVFIEIILLPQKDRNEGSSTFHPTSFLGFEEVFLRILWTLFTTVIDSMHN